MCRSDPHFQAVRGVITDRNRGTSDPFHERDILRHIIPDDSYVG